MCAKTAVVIVKIMSHWFLFREPNSYFWQLSVVHSLTGTRDSQNRTMVARNLGLAIFSMFGGTTEDPSIMIGEV